MSARIDFAALAGDLLDRAPQLLARWLPGGHFKGDEYIVRNPTRTDNQPGSFSVNGKTGAWADFSSGGEGGDLTSLFAYLHGLTQVQAARQLISELGLNGTAKAGAHRNGSGKLHTQSPGRANTKSGNGQLPPTEYKICAEHGTVAAVHVRIDYSDSEGKPNKKIYWKGAKGTSGLNGVSVTALPLYGTERIRAYLDQGADMIVLVEGEKSADSLMRRGIAAVGTATGAGKRPGDRSLAPLLKFQTIILWPDADTKGIEHMQRIAQALERLGHEDLRIVDWPEAPMAGDAADFPGGQDAVEGLLASAVKVENRQLDSQLDSHSNVFIVEKPPEKPLDSEAANTQSGKRPRATQKSTIAIPAFADNALARRLIEAHRDAIRYVADLGRWYVFENGCWRPNKAWQVFIWAREICDLAAGELLAEDPDKLGRLAHSIASAQKRYAVSAQAAVNEDVVIYLEQFDRDSLLQGTPEGVVDLRSGELRPAAAEDYISKSTAVAPAPSGTLAPVWQHFLATTFPKRDKLDEPDSDLIGFVQRWFGYCLTGEIKEHKFLFGYGSGRNGKDTLLDQWYGILGDYAVTLPAETLLQRPVEPHRSELMSIRGARLIFVSEIPDNAKWNQSRLTGITGGGNITANSMRADPVTFPVYGKLVLIGNNLPRFSNHNIAAKDRIQLINFYMKFRAPGEPVEGDPMRTKLRDNDLSAKLKKEWPAIYRWAIDGCLEWQRVGLAPPQLVRNESLESVESVDPFLEWKAEKGRDLTKVDGTIDFAAPGRDLVSVMNKSYNQWREARKEYPLSAYAFRAELDGHGVVTKTRPRVTFGFELTTEEHDRLTPQKELKVWDSGVDELDDNEIPKWK